MGGVRGLVQRDKPRFVLAFPRHFGFQAAVRAAFAHFRGVQRPGQRHVQAHRINPAPLRLHCHQGAHGDLFLADCNREHSLDVEDFGLRRHSHGQFRIALFNQVHMGQPPARNLRHGNLVERQLAQAREWPHCRFRVWGLEQRQIARVFARVPQCGAPRS